MSFVKGESVYCSRVNDELHVLSRLISSTDFVIELCAERFQITYPSVSKKSKTFGLKKTINR